MVLYRFIINIFLTFLINSVFTGFGINYLTNANGIIFFTANDRTNQKEMCFLTPKLWGCERTYSFLEYVEMYHPKNIMLLNVLKPKS